MDRKLELLLGVPLFAGLGRLEIEEVGRLADEIEVPEGRELVHQGRTADEFFVITEGRVRIERDGTTIATLADGDFLGEIALVDGGVRTATAVTETAARLLVLGHREFHSLLDQFPSIQGAVLHALAERVRRVEPEAVY
jgi:CRP/FNR family cyclic AMP-dependent transcriptional regulator